MAELDVFSYLLLTGHVTDIFLLPILVSESEQFLRTESNDHEIFNNFLFYVWHYYVLCGLK